MTRIIPCNLEMYAAYREGETEVKRRVLAFGLYFDNGPVVPMVFDPVMGISEVNMMFLDRYELVEKEEQNASHKERSRE